MVRNVTLDAYVLDVLMRDLAGHDHRPAAYLVYLWLWRNTVAVRVRSAQLSLRQLAEGTGLSRRTVQSSARWLLRRSLIRVERDSPTSIPVYTVLRPWGSKRWRPGAAV